MTSVYHSERLAAAYAFDRPSVHGQFVRSAGLTGNAGRALDVGCGASLSTAALVPLARRVVGLEPVPAMLAHGRVVVPQARFVIAEAERLPFADASFDLVAAAGSLNYADLRGSAFPRTPRTAEPEYVQGRARRMMDRSQPGTKSWLLTCPRLTR